MKATTVSIECTLAGRRYRGTMSPNPCAADDSNESWQNCQGCVAIGNTALCHALPICHEYTEAGVVFTDLIFKEIPNV